MEKLSLPPEYNYVAAFLTMRCNLGCSYCINRHGELRRGNSLLTAEQWVEAINRIETRPDLPVTLQGGEPTQHKDFYTIVNGIRKDIPLDLLTNLYFDADQFMKSIPPDRFKRDAMYASIRVSFHAEFMNRDLWLSNLSRLSAAGYSVGVWLLEHPKYELLNSYVKAACKLIGVDCRTKALLGLYEGKLYGEYQYPGAVNGAQKTVDCQTSELLIGETGFVYKCHADLYARRDPIGHMLDPDFRVVHAYRKCENYGKCNPCDLKVKNDRFQQWGHCSVSIRGADGN